MGRHLRSPEHVSEVYGVNDELLGQQMMIVFTNASATLLEQFTQTNARKVVVMLVDGEVWSAPFFQSAIPGGRLQLTTLGGIREEEIIRLNAAIGPRGRYESTFTHVDSHGQPLE